MALLDVIKKAAENSHPLSSQSDYSIVFNADDILFSLNPKSENPDPISLVSPLVGWKISERDSKVIELAKSFCVKLNSQLKNPKNFGKDLFICDLNSFLESLSELRRISIDADPSDDWFTRLSIEKLKSFIPKDVSDSVLEVCVVLEIWELVEVLIVNGVVKHSSCSNLLHKLVAKRCSNLICLCIKHAFDLSSSDLICILKYFLSFPKDGHESLISVRKEWENQALLAIKKVSDEGVFKVWKKDLNLAKEAAILLMVAHDGFTDNELCLHYLLASSNVDEVVFSSVLSKLNDKEMLGLIRYLGKWLKKYESFPQAVPCPKVVEMFGLELCQWVPKLEDVVKCIGLILDDAFTVLVLNPKFHDEMRCLEGLVCKLVGEARLCASVAIVGERLRNEVAERLGVVPATEM